MLARSFSCWENLTGSAVTRQLTTKNIRRPKGILKVMREDRFRRLRKARGRDLFALEASTKAAVESVTNARDLLMAQLADQVFSKGHTHVATATNIAFVPEGNPAMPLVALAGREQAGKTSLLRSLFRSASQVSRSNRQIRRQAMNYFNVGDVFNLVDLPGYGGTSVPWSALLQHAILLRNFVRYQPSLKMLYYCMDVHYKNGLYVQDIDMLKFLTKEVPNFTIVITKADQIPESDRSTRFFRLQDIRKELLFNDIHHPVLVTSSYRMGGIDTLRFDMVMNCLHALPTERLTMTEARRLSERLLSQRELSTVRHLSILPTQLDDELREWERELAQENQCATAAHGKESSPPIAASAHADGGVGSVEEAGMHHGSGAALSPAVSSPAHEEPSRPPALGEEFTLDLKAIEETICKELTQAPKDGLSRECAVYFPGDPLKQGAYMSLVKKVTNKAFIRYVRSTSPWRNPLLWPKHVIPTKHLKSNLMRCPDDPENPYLFQPVFVAPRADMCFRRPNIGFRRSSQKGRYEPDRPLAILMKSYTIPYFPDIVDTAMHPQPWTFLGSREAFYERGGGRQLGARLLEHATEGQINPLWDNPAPENPCLTQELRALEQQRYSTPIAMLRPPSEDGNRDETTLVFPNAVPALQ